MASFKRPRKILLVDDDDKITQLIQTVLNEDGIPTTVAADGEEALRLIQEGLRPELVIIDLMMPQLNGWDFCAALASSDEYATIPILIMTGGQQIPLKLSFAAVVGFLRKPFSMAGLLGMVDSAIESRGGRVGKADPEFDRA